MRLSFDLALEDENDNTKEWREYFSQRLQAALCQVILTQPFSCLVYRVICSAVRLSFTRTRALVIAH